MGSWFLEIKVRWWRGIEVRSWVLGFGLKKKCFENETLFLFYTKQIKLENYLISFYGFGVVDDACFEARILPKFFEIVYSSLMRLSLNSSLPLLVTFAINSYKSS